MSNVTYLHSATIDVPKKLAPLPRRKIDWTIPALIAVNFLVFGFAVIGLIQTFKSI